MPSIRARTGAASAGAGRRETYNTEDKTEQYRRTIPYKIEKYLRQNWAIQTYNTIQNWTILIAILSNTYVQYHTKLNNISYNTEQYKCTISYKIKYNTKYNIVQYAGVLQLLLQYVQYNNIKQYHTIFDTVLFDIVHSIVCWIVFSIVWYCSILLYCTYCNNSCKTRAYCMILCTIL